MLLREMLVYNLYRVGIMRKPTDAADREDGVVQMRGLKKGRECLESIGGDDTINKQQEWLYRCLTYDQNSRVSIAGICYLNLNPTYFDINRDRMGTLNVVQAEFHRPGGCMPDIPSTSLENVPNVCIGDRERTAIMASLMTMRL